ncbi:MAG: hypothetical protein K1X28_06420 [Parachlamydiales bacterium]|nr:hypothetical protein [Parachlamydiales bacterium]
MKNLYYRSGKIYASLTDEKREYFYEDGTLKTSEEFRDGKLHGQSLLFWPNGRLKRQCYFENGVRHGLDQMWDEAGNLADEGRYEQGKPVGIHRRFRKNGAPLEEIEYLGDSRFNLREWDEKGEIKVEALWNDFDYHERVWDRFQNIWVEKDGYWNGKKLVYI